MMNFETRDQIEERYRWDLESVFASDEEFLAALDDAQRFPAEAASFQGKISQSPEQLLAFLKADEQAGLAIGKLVTYSQRKSDEDTRNATYQDYAGRVMDLYTQIAMASSWSTPELLTLGEDDTERFYRECPELEPFRRALDRVFRQREHTLSPAEEAILARASDMARQPENIFSLLNNADMRFDDAIDAQGAAHPVTHGTYIPLMMQPDRTLRESAFKSMYAAYDQLQNTCAATLQAQLKSQKFYADVRNFGSTLEGALHGTEVPTEVYTSLIEAVHRHLPALHKYIGLRKRLLGLDELHYHDLYVPVVEDVEMSFTYEEACELILEALAPMGEEYLAIVREGLASRWIDVYETPGKRSGAYSAGGYGMHPFILLNFQGQLEDVYTLIHEMGHSIHTYLSCQNQPPVYADYVIFVAEVASTCNEALLTRHLLAKYADDPRLRAYILNHFLEQFRTTLYRQCMFAEFELMTNEMVAAGQGITAEALCERYGQLNIDYQGPEIEADEQISLEWARIPHFYYNYYVYQYATGFAAAIALSEQILGEGAPAVERYLGFLKGGSSKTPIELLQGAGVDMATPAPIDEALELFDKLVDELADLL